MTWWPGFASPWYAALFLLLIPLVIVYFLKLKRPRVELPSLALWRQVIQDQRVNSPFQKFKRNLLLWLQVALLCLLVLAVMQPFVAGGSDRADHVPILIDCSASMAATDASGRSRLDLAKDDVRALIEGLLPGQKLTLVAVTNTARRLTEFTDNKPVLLAELDRLQVSDVPSRLEDGLRLAQALSKTYAVPVVRLYSDGNLPTTPDAHGQPVAIVDFDLPFQLDYHQLPAAGPNMGITAFNARRASTDAWDVFVRVEGSGTSSTAGKLTLRISGVPTGDPESVVLDPGTSQRLVFHVSAATAVLLEARLQPDGSDALAADNVAFLDLPAGRPLTVYCPPSLASYRHALQAVGGLVVEPGDDGSLKLSSFDLVVSDALADLSREAATYLFVGVVPNELQPLLEPDPGPIEVVDWQRDAPLLQHVQLKEVQIAEAYKKRSGIEDGDLEELGYELLAVGSRGPLVVSRREARSQSYYLLFASDRSTLPYRVGFFILVDNLVDIALQQEALSELRGAETGVLPAVSVRAKTEYTVTAPNGDVLQMTSDDAGSLAGVPAPRAGLYRIAGAGSRQQVGASLLNSAETSLRTVHEIQFNELPVSARTERVATDWPLWPKLAFAAFGMLLVEWWYFQRKPGGL